MNGTGTQVSTGYGSQVWLLRDGAQVLIRAISADDAHGLTDGFGRLSQQSRRMRFLSAKPRLSADEVRYLTDVDHHRHEALGAVSLADGRGVGVARFIRLPDEPAAAELALTVVDAWQRRGLGRVLLTALADRAREEGIGRFTALVSVDNTAMIGLLWKMGARLGRESHGTMDFEIPLGTRRYPAPGTVL
jgi:RimJ/RimL family protein N-acetyltransferase